MEEKSDEKFKNINILEIFEQEDISDKFILKLFFYFMKKKHKDKAIELLTLYIKSKNHIYTIKNDKDKEVWIYKNGIYVPNGISEIKEQFRKLLHIYYNSLIINSVLERIFADTFIDSKEFFTENQNNTHLLPVQNGLLNLLTKELLSFTPSIRFFNKLPIHYNLSATCPNIEKHFENVLNSSDDKKVLFELIGFCLWKEHFIEKAFLFSGSGRNGKGKTIELIKKFLGGENCSAVPLSEMNEGNFSISEIFGKMVNIAGDLSSTALKDTGVFKGLTGRDLIGGNRKFSTKIYFTSYAKNIFACNELPKVYDNSIGFWERWIVLDFPYHFIDEKEFEKIKKEKGDSFQHNFKIADVDILNKLSTKEELEGLLNKAIEGLHTLLKNKKFSYSKGTDEIKKSWLRNADSFSAFCQDHLESGDIHSDFILKSNIRSYYHSYCSTNNLKGCSDIQIKINLETFFGVSDFRNHNQETYWCGIKINSNSSFAKIEENFNKNIKEIREKQKLFKD